MRRTLLVGLALGVIVTTSLPIGAALPDAASPVNEQWNELFGKVLITAVVVSIVVYGMLIFILVRFRAKKGGPKEGPHIHGNTRMEIAWTIAPTVVMAWLLIISFEGLSIIDEPAGEDVEFWIGVEAFQFGWEFEYPDQSKVTNGTLRLEQNRVYGFNITSRDVIHAFSVPDLGIMKDAVPGRTTHSWVKAIKTGAYAVKCRELCGVGHSRMAANLNETGVYVGPTVYVFAQGSEGDRHWGFAPEPAAPAPSGNQTAGREVPVTLGPGGSLAFDPKELKVQPQETVTFLLKNEAGQTHNLYIGNFSAGPSPNGASRFSPDVEGGQAASWTVTFGGDSTYEFWCNVPGHRFGYLSGMSGVFTVGNGSAGGAGVPVKTPLLPGPEPFLLAVGFLVAFVLVRRKF